MARINRTRCAVLGMLSIAERSGYDLKVEFERRMSHFWAESVGQIYPALKLLRSEGLVEARREAGSGRRARTIYSITDEGRRELREWLREPPLREQVRNEILLKLYFGPEMGVETALAHVARFEAGQRAMLELMELFEQEIVDVATSDEQELFWKITLSSGLHVVRARIAWCEESSHALRRFRKTCSPAESPSDAALEAP